MKEALYNGKAAIFDLDGTLLDTLGDLAAAGNYVLQKHGFLPVPDDGYRYYVGNGMRNMVRQALTVSLKLEPRNIKINDDLIGVMLDEATQYYENNWHNRTCLYAGIADFLGKLAEKRIPFAVCSNKYTVFVKKTVDYYLPAVPFAEVLGQQDDIPLKPDTTGALRLAKLMKTEPQDVVFVGDTRVDMQTANSAGMFAVGVSWGFRTKEELREHGARLIVDKPEEILRCFG